MTALLIAILFIGIVLWIVFALACLGGKMTSDKIVYGICSTTTFVLLLVGVCIYACIPIV